MKESKYDALKIENQICFPLYAGSREIIKRYKPYLDELGLTYTQYITMMILWEEKEVTVKQLGKRLYLDSGTLTPLLKKLEAKGLITRVRPISDERSLIVSITREGAKLRDLAVDIPAKMAPCLHLTEDEAKELYRLLYKILAASEDEEE